MSLFWFIIGLFVGFMLAALFSCRLMGWFTSKNREAYADRDRWRRRAEWLARFWADEIMWDGRNDGKSWAEIVTEKSKAAADAVQEATDDS